ncbi:MAG: hypothetical protein HC806_09635 [Anaerolineae bacterium]|nr:hypothetical protein [Anaerolineae bacterium]
MTTSIPVIIEEDILAHRRGVNVPVHRGLPTDLTSREGNGVWYRETRGYNQPRKRP